jgi:predicted Zn-dependent protease
MSSSRGARVAVVVVCVVVIAWLGVGLAAERLGHHGERTRSEGDLRRAASLTPDKSPTLTRAKLLARRGRRGEAVALVLGLTRDEPENAEYWAALAQLAARDRPALAARARARLRELVPPVGS